MTNNIAASQNTNLDHHTPVDNELRVKIRTCSELINTGKYAEVKSILAAVLFKHQESEANITPEIKQALLYYADAQRLTHSYLAAYRNYALALKVDIGADSMILPNLFTCLALIRDFSNDDIDEAHLLAFIKSSNTDNNELSTTLVYFFKQHFGYHHQDYEINLADLMTHQIFLAALPALVFTDQATELFITHLRKEILLLCIQQGAIPELIPLAEAIGLHEFRCDYITSVSPFESQLIAGLQSQLTKISPISQQLDQCSHSIHLIAMYLPLTALPDQNQLHKLDINRWPATLRKIAQVTLLNYQAEKILTASIPCLTKNSSRDAVSNKVRQQYEANPYPKWHSINILPSSNTYTEIFPYLPANIKNSGQFDHTLNCLVAGCGTGKHPLSLAKNISNVAITALDISLPSLAYGQRMATELGINTVKFIHGNILDLGEIGEKFDVVESVGVIHHMQHPLAGLKKLLAVLKPEGLLSLGLYSEIARKNIINIRAQHDLSNIEPSIENIRMIRQQLFDSSETWYETFKDFFSTAECRDLLFHRQELQFNLPQIKQILTEHQLEFLGFRLPALISANYRHRFPTDPSMTNLDNWHQFEIDHPDTFLGMYQFHCQKRS
ncbi:MAG: class I SAM-dependent methyltransferase [Pseudomonadales bacterium]|nr:class I SAM-dependent methyltransferase [Pseudomonadales bacterium]